MSYDRLSKFLFLNPLREENTIDTDFVPILPRKIPTVTILQPPLDLTKLVTLFRSQISEGRAYLYARDYAIAMARFQGKTQVEQSDIDVFCKLFSPYLGAFSKLQQRMSIEDTVIVCSGHIELLTQIGRHMDGIAKQELAESLLLTQDHIGRCASFLVQRGLIREEERKYHLSTELDQFFTWYKDTFSVQMPQPKSQT
jgi:hypothetical protein